MFLSSTKSRMLQADIRSKMEENMLDPVKLQQFAITVADADFDEALGGGKIPKSGYVSVKASGVKHSDGKDSSKDGKGVRLGKRSGKRGRLLATRWKEIQALIMCSRISEEISSLYL